jgi:L-rhamnose mutarotase
MKRYARTIDLKDDPQIIDAYVAHHRAVWPEVETRLRGIGIERMLIWRLGRRLFMLVEAADGFDWDRDFARYMEGGGRIAEWQELMDSFQQPVADAKPGEGWAEMEQVYELE